MQGIEYTKASTGYPEAPMNNLRTIATSLLAILVLSAAPCLGQAAPNGLWLTARKDPRNTARCDVPAHMKLAPKEVWRYGGAPDTYAFVAPVRVKGRDLYFTQV